MFRLVCSIAFSISFLVTNAQESFTIQQLTTERHRTNNRIARSYGAVGLANIGVGIGAYTGSFIIDQQYYGVGNIVLGGMEIAYALSKIGSAKREENLNLQSAYEHYSRDFQRVDLRMYRDIAFMALGSAGALFSGNEVVEGIGVALAQQGIILIFVDGLSYISYNTRADKWGKLLRAVTVSGNSVGLSFQL